MDGVSFEVEREKSWALWASQVQARALRPAPSSISCRPRQEKIVGGSIDFNGTDVLKLSQKELLEFRGKDISMIFQNPMTSLSPVFKVGSQMVEMICAHQKVTKKEAWDMAVEALKKVGIPSRRRGWRRILMSFQEVCASV